MRQKLAKIPTSKAKNAYELLSEIAALTNTEPKRMRMSAYRTQLAYLSDKEVPACGTVGCIAGWVTALKQPDANFMGAGDIGCAILGITERQAGMLFYGDLVRDRTQGTRRHANRVIALIRRFQKQHAAQLKAKKV